MYELDDRYGGRMAECECCGKAVMLPIRDPEKLLEFARSARWEKALEFRNHFGARGHSRRTIQKFIRIMENRRWAEEFRVYRANAVKEKRHLMSPRERLWRRAERRLKRRQSLEKLRLMDPTEFEELIAELFNAQGYSAEATGGAYDGGVDVKVRDAKGGLWAVAQCKRYGERTLVTPSQIRGFCGAYALSGAERGFFLTTGSLTAQAKLTARRFSWEGGL